MNLIKNVKTKVISVDEYLRRKKEKPVKKRKMTHREKMIVYSWMLTELNNC